MGPRRRSLLKDKNDINQFRHHRDRHVGHCVSNEFYQPTPFFFTRECSQLNLVGQYKGASAFLILNGPSLVSGDYDLSLMKKPGVITYGVNNGPATFRPNFWSCVDDPQRFLKSIWMDPMITKFVPHAHSEKPIFDGEEWEDVKKDGKKVLVGECPNCIFFHRNEKFEPHRWLFEDKINWGNSKTYGGGRSVMLPAMRILFLLGFRKIYLMGADFTMSEDYTYHFDERREKGAVNCNRGTYKKMKNDYFPKLQKEFIKEGLEVYNCNPDSGLGDIFPHISYLDAIAEATAPLGPVDNERTWGMYCKPGDKDNWKDEPTQEDKPYLKNFEKRDELVTASRAHLADSGQAMTRPVISQEPAVIETPVIETVPLRDANVPSVTPNYRVKVDNTDENEEVAVASNQKVVPQETDTGIRTVSIKPEIEEVIEIPQAPKPPNGGQVAGQRKLIKNLPFRS